MPDPRPETLIVTIHTFFPPKITNISFHIDRINMPIQSNTRVFERLIPSLMMLRDEALRLEQSFAEELGEIEPVYRASARNLLHYLGGRCQGSCRVSYVLLFELRSS